MYKYIVFVFFIINSIEHAKIKLLELRIINIQLIVLILLHWRWTEKVPIRLKHFVWTFELSNWRTFYYCM